MPEQISLSWQNLNVTIREKQKTFWKTKVTEKNILNNVSGTATSHSLFAIMGSSGCGKTTLLNAISGRRREKTGVVQMNETSISDENIRNMSGYVPQQDIFTEYLTVSEHMKFMAALQLNDKSNVHRSIIKQLLSELGLENQSSTLIKNLSGGEKRRLSLAGELMRNPLIMFCDEPTSGLDSYNAITVVQKLKTIAYSGKIVLATIHQPSSQLFHYFDNITLLAEGKLVFQGTTEEAKSFFESMNLICPFNYNPADFYIKCMTSENVIKLCKAFEERLLPEDDCSRCDHTNSILVLEKKVKNSFLHELKWLLWRSYLTNKRNSGVHLAGYALVIFEVIFVGLFYADIGFADKQSAQNIEGFVSFLGTEFTFTNMYSVINVFPAEVAVFVREKDLYSSSAYFISKVLSMLPLVLFSTILYMSLLFAMVRFLDGFYLWLEITYLMFLVGMASCGLGLAFSATFGTVEQIDVILGPVEFLLLLFSGNLIKLDTVPTSLIWIKFLSPLYYGFDSVSNLLWSNVTDIGSCTGNETIPCYSNGTQVLQIYGVYKNYDTVSYDVLYMHILTAVFCIIGFVGIVRKKFFYSI